MEAFAWPEPNADAFYSIYSVYDFNGKELIPQGSAWKDLYDAGFVDTTLHCFTHGNNMIALDGPR